MLMIVSSTTAADPTDVNLPRHDPRLPLSMLLTFAASIVVFGMHYLGHRFTTDAWAYEELANSFFNEPYQTNTIRQYQFDTRYSASFPPLYPLLLAGWKAVFQTTIYGGIAVNILLSWLTYYALFRLCPKLNFPPWFASLLYFGLLANEQYCAEIVGARSAPLAILLWVNILALYLDRERPALWRQGLLGLLAGLSVMTRFDFGLWRVAVGIVECARLAHLARRGASRDLLRGLIRLFAALDDLFEPDILDAICE